MIPLSPGVSLIHRHLLRNLGDALQGATDRRRGAMRQAARAITHEAGAASEEVALASHDTKEMRLKADRRARRLVRYEELRRLHESGVSVQEIAPALGMGCRSAWKFGSSAASVQIVVMLHGSGAP